MIRQSETKWLALARPSARARFRLFYLPHAGIGASVFRTWIGGLGSTVDVCPVQPPGRETRHVEPPFSSITELADAATEALLPYCDVPFSLFGHSMGALAAFEIARRLDGRNAPARLFVSARRAPHLPDRLAALGPLDDVSFVKEIQYRYGGIPTAVLACDDLMAMLLPRLRADVAALENYVFQADRAFHTPITAFGGDSDWTVPLEDLEGWREHSTADVCVRLIRGGHLFLQEQKDALLGFISTDLCGSARGFRISPVPVRMA